MWEVDIENKKTGKVEMIFGYGAMDAFRRCKLDPDDWWVIGEIYMD